MVQTSDPTFVYETDVLSRSETTQNISLTAQDEMSMLALLKTVLKSLSPFKTEKAGTTPSNPSPIVGYAAQVSLQVTSFCDWQSPFPGCRVSTRSS